MPGGKVSPVPVSPSPPYNLVRPPSCTFRRLTTMQVENAMAHDSIPTRRFPFLLPPRPANSNINIQLAWPNLPSTPSTNCPHQSVASSPASRDEGDTWRCLEPGRELRGHARRARQAECPRTESNIACYLSILIVLFTGTVRHQTGLACSSQQVFLSAPCSCGGE